MSYKRLAQIIANYSLPLAFGILLALLWSNANPLTYHNFWTKELYKGLSAEFFVNDVFMALFFALACVDIVKSFYPGGALSSWNKAVTPLLATLGGVCGPIVIFFSLNYLFGSTTYTRGWAIPTATDIAVSLLFARIIFGPKHAALSFLTLLAVADDAIGLVIIAVFYPDLQHPFAAQWLLLVVAAVITALFMNRYLQVKNYWAYLLVPGLLSWVGLHNSHLHPALALTFIVPFLPGLYLDDKGRQHSALLDFEKDFKPFITLGLFFFGLANAGVKIEHIEELTIIIFLALFVGKTAGIFALSTFAVKLGYDLPDGLQKKELFVLAMVCSVGLTVSLFVANQAYADVALQNSAKMGALLSVTGCLLAYVLSKIFKVKKQNF